MQQLKRLSANVVGFITLCGLIWFALPKLGVVSIWVRLTAIFIILLLAIAIVVARWWLIQQRGVKLHEQLQAQQESMAGRQLEIAVLKEKMDDAISALKTSDLGVHYRGSAALYALPWYMVIGPAAAGKSTLLRNSGLHFPLASQDDIRVKGYGGTRNCDWWFADEAVLLDTAGRYTTEEDDREEWKTFLLMIKKYRPRLPINGILVVLSLVDLLTADTEGLKWHVKVIRERIAEMTQELGYVFPVYIVFSKVDLVEGFNTFFTHLSEAERKQVWSINFASMTNQNSKIDYFKQQLERLYGRLGQLRLPKLGLESDVLNRLSIIDFPQQFLKCSEQLNEFLPLLFKENPYQETPNFNGVYFTSGAQSYFIRDFFGKVVFNDKESAVRSQKKMLMWRWLKSASAAIALGVIVSAVFMYSASFTSNLLLVRQGAQLANTLSNQLNLNTLLEASSYVDELVQYKQDIPLHLRLGLYRGNDLLPALSAIVVHGMNNYFLAPTAQAMENELQQDALTWQTADTQQRHNRRGDYYSLLKAYLMLCEPAHMDANFATPILAHAWNSVAGIPAQTLSPIVHFYVTQPGRQAWTLNQDLVNTVRAQLYSATNINNLYAQIRTKGLAQLGNLSVSDLINTPSGNLLVNSMPLPAMFTKKGWQDYAKPEIDRVAEQTAKGDWVMGEVTKSSPEEQAQIASQMRALYFNDYTQAWYAFLNSVQLQHFHSLDQAAKMLSIVADNKGPFVALLNAIEQNSKIVTPREKDELNKNLPAYLKKVSAMKGDLERLAVSPDVGRDSQTYAAQLLSGNGSNSALYQVSVSANVLVTNIGNAQAQQALQNVLLIPVRGAWQAILAQAVSGLNQQWQSQVINSYQQTLANKFPFANSDDNASADAISEFLQPTHGVLWQFVNQYLTPFLTATSNGWQERTWLGIGAGFSPSFLQALTIAKNISNNLFADGGDTPAFTIELYPEPTPGLREISMSTNGQTYRYRNDPQEWQKLRWPGEPPNDDTVLQIMTAEGDSHGSMEFESVWGFFKLLQHAELAPDSDGALRATWDIRTDSGRHYHVSFLVRNGSRHNLFKELLLERLNLPNQLFTNN